MTEQDWKAVESKLLHPYGYAKLMVDGYRIDLQLQPETAFKNVIAVYINGEIQGKWLTSDCEERRRFFQKTKHTLLRKTKDFYKLSKKRQKALEAMAEQHVFCTYTCFWGSFKKLKAHLIKNNNSIEILYEGC